MNLLVFAHRAEAKAFINEMDFRSVKGYDSFNLYFNEKDYLLICGEGNQAATEHLSAVTAVFHEKINSIVNMGIAGALNKELGLNKVYSIQSAYGQKDQASMLFKSYESADHTAKFDCITAIERVLTDSLAEYLSLFGQIVDRELWGIASVAKFFKIPFFSYKMISDYAGSSTSCFDISNRSDFFSDSLLNHYLSVFDKSEKQAESLVPNLPEGFYFTLSQKRQYEKLLEKLKKKYKKTEQDIFSLLNLKEMLEKDIPAKLKSKYLLEKMDDLLSPADKKIKLRLGEIFKGLDKDPVSIKLSKNIEETEFHLSARVRSEEDFNRLKKAIEGFDYKQYLDFMNGKDETI